MRSLADLWCGIRRHPWKMAQFMFATFSVVFTLAKGATYFFPTVKFQGPSWLSTALIISVISGLNKVWKPSQIEIALPNCNTSVEVTFGDLFNQEGVRAIAVNEFFDSKLGRPVSDRSVHGIFLQRCFGGHSESFDRQVEQQLSQVHYINVDKIEGKTKCYPIGSTAVITVNQDRYIMFAFAKTDPATCKAYSDIGLMWIALHNLWRRARVEAGGHAINLPLVGSGLSGLGLPTRDLLNLIILSVITETKAHEIASRVRIVLHRDRFNHLDLRDIKRHWEE